MAVLAPSATLSLKRSEWEGGCNRYDRARATEVATTHSKIKTKSSIHLLVHTAF